MKYYEDDFLIGQYPKGYPLSLLNTIYHHPKKDPNGKWLPPAIDLIIKDIRSGEKFLETIINPEYEYYMLLDGKEVPRYTLEYAMKEDCKRIITPFISLQKDIADRLGKTNEFFENIRNRNRAANKVLCNYNPAILMSDMDIEDNIRFQFANSYENSYTKPSKSFLDIEADTINCKGDFVELGECPINAVSFIDDQSLIVHSFLLRNKENPLIEKFEKECNKPSLNMRLRQFLIDAVGGEKQACKYKIDKMTVQFHFYDEEGEIVLLKHLFNYINNIKPDVVLAWNMAFDIPYIIQRIINLGYNPKDIMCHPDFRYKEVNYFIDEKNKFNYEERNDFAKISSYSVYLDQMIHFASRRKGQKAIEKYVKDRKKDKLFGVVLCLYTGLRLGELLALEWDDIDLAERTIRVSKSCFDRWENRQYRKIVGEPKTDSSRRIIPYPRQLSPWLKALKKRSESKRFISGEKGEEVSVRSYQKSFELLLRKLKIPRRGIHSLRHTFATRALECGMDVRTLSEILGHKNPTVTLKRYAHSLMEHKCAMI